MVKKGSGASSRFCWWQRGLGFAAPLVKSLKQSRPRGWIALLPNSFFKRSYMLIRFLWCYRLRRVWFHSKPRRCRNGSALDTQAFCVLDVHQRTYISCSDGQEFKSDLGFVRMRSSVLNTRMGHVLSAVSQPDVFPMTYDYPTFSRGFLTWDWPRESWINHPIHLSSFPILASKQVTTETTIKNPPSTCGLELISSS